MNARGGASGRLGSLCARDGSCEISVAPGALPPVLLEANTLIRQGRSDRAMALLGGIALGRILEEVDRDPSRTDVMYVTAKLLADGGRPDLAEPWLRRLLGVEAHPKAYSDLGCLCYESRRFREAAGCFGQAHALDPENVSYATAYGSSLMAMGQTEEGLDLLRRAADRHPDHPQTVPMWLWNLHYVPGHGRAFFHDQYRRWALRHAPSRSSYVFHNDPDPGRRIRVGFISPDFRSGSVASGFEAFLDAYDRGQIEAIGYGCVRCPDRTTQRLAGKFDRFKAVTGLPPEAIAEQIAGDRVDILVEIGGHIRDNALQVLALRPAPIQVDYGGIDTSGEQQIDYRITDALLDPPPSQECYIERLVYLEGGANCLCPPAVSPPVQPLPAQRNGFVTYGSFNNNIKLSPLVLSLWGDILRARPEARMVLKFGAAGDPAIGEAYYRRFEAMGVSRQRVDILGDMPYEDHLRCMGGTDLLLDSYPYNGCMTTLEGLWMGVPTLSLVGDLWVSREGLSILSRVHLEAFVAATTPEYVGKALAFASQTDALGQIRGSLRPLMQSSPLCGAQRFAAEMTEAFRRMWRHWCEETRQATGPCVRCRVEEKEEC